MVSQIPPPSISPGLVKVVLRDGAAGPSSEVLGWMLLVVDAMVVKDAVDALDAVDAVDAVDANHTPLQFHRALCVEELVVDVCSGGVQERQVAVDAVDITFLPHLVQGVVITCVPPCGGRLS